MDVGDHIQGGTLGAVSDGSAIIKIMNEVKFDVVVLGNHEFDYGIETLNSLEENITSRYICSNFCFKKNRFYWGCNTFNFYQNLFINIKR